MTHNYQSSYQSGGGGFKGRRRDYDDVNNSHVGSRLQSMQILSDEEYGRYDKNESHYGLVWQPRYTIYAAVAFLMLIVILAPHRDLSPDSNLPPHRQNSTNASGGGNNEMTSNNNNKEVSSSSNTEMPATKPKNNANNNINNATSCEAWKLSSSFRRDSNNFTYLNVTNFCLREVSSNNKMMMSLVE